MEQKRKWEAPTLAVLIRSTQEERILFTCKMYDLADGPFGNDGQCYLETCEVCSTQASS